MSTTQASELVDALYDVLEDATSWTGQTPKVYYSFEVPQSERGPGADMPPQLYVHEIAPAMVTKFTADNDEMDEVHQAEIQIWLLKDESDYTAINTIRRDVIAIISDLFADNNSETRFIDFTIEQLGDYRQQSVAIKSDHFIHTIQVNGRRLTAAGL